MSCRCTGRPLHARSLKLHAAFLAHFASVTSLRCTVDLLVFLCNDKVISCLVALVLTKRTVWPVLHQIKIVLTTDRNSPLGKINVPKNKLNVKLFHLKRFVRNTDTRSVYTIHITIDGCLLPELSFPSDLGTEMSKSTAKQKLMLS